MPKCSYCNKILKDRQALGSHIRTHLYDSDDEDSNHPIYGNSQNVIETTHIISDQSISERTEAGCTKKVRVEKSLDNFQRTVPGIDESVEEQDQVQEQYQVQEQVQVQVQDQAQDLNNFDFVLDHESDSQNSDEESVTSDLSFTTDVNADDYNEYSALFTGIPSDPNDVYQEFPSEEFAEFMHMITKFRVQDPLANAFIRFFNKYSNRDDKPLPSTSQVGREFVENLQLPGFKWRKEKIFEYQGEEYIFEYRTVLDGIHQILMNKSLTEDFIFEYKPSVDSTDAKILLGYIPSLEYHSLSEKQSAQFRSASRNLFHCALATILRPLRVISNTGIHLYVNGNLKWFYPYLALIIADWPEACAMCTIYGSPNSLHPCHFCLIDRNAMNNVHIKQEDIIIRNEHNIKDALRYGNGKQISVHYIRNALWKRP
ncbi:unnamed protein product [Rhizophagus irregularis]|nr:unnamed protein product [Rhizophagus irregularis]